MITVCVPVYNTDVRPLARQLSEQAARAPVPVEILLYDDGSEEHWHRHNGETATLPGTVYRRGESNLGRAALRNLLGQSARFPWLLFLDADSMLPTGDFLIKYLSHLPTEGVLCGGTLYHDEPPEASSQLLRWTYGRNREQRPAAIREKENGFAITANNFMINREVLLAHPFREAIKGYGHEDTLLGYDLRQAGITIHHIDNPVFHTGLETSGEYLEKSRAALANLLYISRHLVRDPRFDETSGLLRGLKRAERWGLRPLAAALFSLTEPRLRAHLTGPHPSLLLFDLYRAGYLCSLSNQKPLTPK